MNNYHSTKKPFIAKCFEVSTGHITKEDDELIRQTVQVYKEGDIGNTNLIVYPYEEGCFIFAAYENDEVDEIYKKLKAEGYSREFVDLLYLARKHKCKYLQLDSDGVEYIDLPTFNW